MVYPHNEHRCISGGCGNNNLLCAAFKMLCRLFHCGKQPCGFQNVLNTCILPGNFLRIHYVENRYLMSVYNQLAVLILQLAVETTMCRVIFQHINHVIYINKGIVYRNDIFYIAAFQSRTEKQATDSAKTIDTNLSHKKFLLTNMISCVGHFLHRVISNVLLPIV